MKCRLNIYSDLLQFKNDDQATEVAREGFENLKDSLEKLSGQEL